MDNVRSIGRLIYDLHWYQLSHRDRFIVQMMIQRSEQQYEVKALGIFVCSLETYLKVQLRIFIQNSLNLRHFGLSVG